LEVVGAHSGKISDGIKLIFTRRQRNQSQIAGIQWFVPPSNAMRFTAVSLCSTVEITPPKNGK
jgi:hypothetical protein